MAIYYVSRSGKRPTEVCFEADSPKQAAEIYDQKTNPRGRDSIISVQDETGRVYRFFVTIEVEETREVRLLVGDAE